MPLEVFYSYSHRDEQLRVELEKHLSLLRRNNLIVAWNDRCIGAGDEWRDQIDEHLRSAHIILLLISADFLASDYCYDVEMKLALDRHARHEAIVIPIVLRPVDWSGANFAHLQALPKDAKAVVAWPDRDEAFTDVARGIREIVLRFGSLASNSVVARDTVLDDYCRPKPRVLDAAIPNQIVKDDTTELLVLIRLPDSTGLAGILMNDQDAQVRPEDVRSNPFSMTFPFGPDGNLEPLKTTVKVTSPEFSPPEQSKNILVPTDSDSDVCPFILTPLRIGRLRLLVELQWEDTLRGHRSLVTECSAEARTAGSPPVMNVVRIPMVVHPDIVNLPPDLESALVTTNPRSLGTQETSSQATGGTGETLQTDRTQIRLGTQHDKSVSEFDIELANASRPSTVPPRSVSGPSSGGSTRGSKGSLIETATSVKLGRLPRSHNKNIPMLHTLLEGQPLAPIPASLDYTANMPAELGMMGSDTLGDCTCAAFYHAVQVWSFNSEKQIETEPDLDAVELYEQACGYNPKQGGEGPGGNVQHVLTYLLKQGAPFGPKGQQRHKITAFTEVDVKNIDDVKRTIYDHGVVYIGFNVPQYIMDPNGQPLSVWDIEPKADNTIVGGHAVVLAGYNASGARVIAWGQYYTMTWAFFEKFVDEAYAITDPLWTKTTSRVPAKLLDQYMQKLKEG